jgi:signal transduction histidine kinase
MRVLVVDDHEVVRRGVRSLLEPHCDVCGEAVDGKDAVEKSRQLKPDVVVMDVSMPNLNGLEATPLIRHILPDCEVLILSQHESPQMVQQALKAGARGYVVKSSVARDLLAALERVRRHEAFFDPAIPGMTERSSYIASETLPHETALPSSTYSADVKLNILMVDDEPSKLLSYEAVLTELGENLIKTQSGAEALEQLLKNEIAIVLMDVKMPELDGFELAKMIREHPRYQHIAIIFISAARITDLDRLKGYANGAVDYISVPLVPELLRAKVKVFAELYRKSRQLEMLSAQMIELQDKERKRIARELHDGVGQMLAALSMNSSIVQSQSDRLDTRGARAVSENAQLLEQVSREIRTMSHLLHPPLIEVAGLASALRWYVDGFSERSKIKVDLEIPSDFERLPNDTELAIFRIVQECLTNIHRHSGSKTAAIRLQQEEGRLIVQIQDRGKGIPNEKLQALKASGKTGVGFGGMRERLRQLQGTLDVQSDGNGTVVSAVLNVNGQGLRFESQRKFLRPPEAVSVPHSTNDPLLDVSVPVRAVVPASDVSSARGSDTVMSVPFPQD